MSQKVNASQGPRTVGQGPLGTRYCEGQWWVEKKHVCSETGGEVVDTG